MLTNHRVNGGGASSMATSVTPLTSASGIVDACDEKQARGDYEREINAPESRPVESPDLASGQTTVLAPGQKAGDQDEKGKRSNREAISDRVVMPARNFRIVEQMPVSDDVEHAHRAHDIDRYLARRRRGMCPNSRVTHAVLSRNFHPNPQQPRLPLLYWPRISARKKTADTPPGDIIPASMPVEDEHEKRGAGGAQTGPRIRLAD